MQFWILVILAILAVWGLASAVVSFLNVGKARKGLAVLPEGLFYRSPWGVSPSSS